MIAALKFIGLVLTAVAALLIEIAFLCWYLLSAAVDVLLIGNEKANVRRQFK